MKKPKSSSFKSIAIKELLRLSEKKLQGMVIEPLLRSLGFENVRDNSGPNEKGKDIVATKVSEFGRNKLFAVQIKKKKFTGTVDSKESLGNLFHQLIQARDEEVVDPINNIKRSPDSCIFITPYPISPSVWEKFHKLSEELYRKNIEIIDGSKLLDLIKMHLPDFLQWFSMEVRYLFQLERSMNKIPESMLAFFLDKELELNNIYVDASLDSSNNFFENLAAYTLWLQGPKLLIVYSKDIIQIENFGKDLNKNAIIIDPPQAKDYEQKQKLLELKEKLGKQSKKKIAQIDLDPLLICAQEKARKGLSTIANLPIKSRQGQYTDIVLEFVKTKETICDLQNFDPIMDYWVSLVKKDKKPEWTKPKIRIPSSLLKDIDCNKYILGEPGAGKTTLLRKLTQEYSKMKDSVLPIYLPLVLVREASEESLIKSCIHQLENQGYLIGKTSNKIGLFLKNFSSGVFQLYLDGLDETGSNANELFSVIVDLSASYPNSRITLSCRSTFETPPFKGAFELKLTPFNEKQLQTFLKNWFNSQPTALEGLNEWLESNEKIKNAATNPLVAALLCSLYYLGAEMPTTEIELYERRFELLLGKWDYAKGIKSLNREIVKRYWKFIMDLAMDMHNRGLRTISISEANFYAEKYYTKKFHYESTEMVRDCVHRGIIEFEAFGGLSFGHLTYQEYLTAKKLSVDNDVGFVFKKMNDPWWSNVIRFYASIKEDITPLVKLAIEANSSEEIVDFIYDLFELAPWTEQGLIEKL